MEYLFRGKRIDDGRWACGSLIKRWTGTKYEFVINEWPFDYTVEPSTVGLCSNLPDKNGRKIFSGDIILWGDRIARERGTAVYAVVEFRSGCFGITEGGRFHEFWHYAADKWDYKEITDDMWGEMPIEKYFRACFEIVGNKWDNADLLEVAK
jgi:hypothetical protein